MHIKRTFSALKIVLNVKTIYYKYCRYQWKPVYEPLATWITRKIDTNLTAMNGTSLHNSRLFEVIKIFETEKFRRDFVFSSTSSLKFLVFYMRVPYNVVPLIKSCNFIPVKLY